MHTTIALMLLLTAAALLAAGCAGTDGTGEDLTEGAPELPQWVTILVPERDGRSLFVGGVSFAADLESGLEAAEADARSQVQLSATRLFTEKFNRAVQKSEIETEPIDRLDFKNSVLNDYGPIMSELATRDDVYHRPCGDPSAEAGGDEGGSPVCQVFVMVSVGADEWYARMTEALALEKERRRQQEQQELAELAEWMMRDLSEPRPGENGRQESKE